MRHIILRAAVVAILVIGAARAFAVPTGAVATRTGARGFGTKAAEPTCTACHSPDLSGVPAGINDPSGSIRLFDVPTSYVPGTIYTLRVRVAHDWAIPPANPLRWGFQLQAIQANTGDSSGTWVLTPNVSPDSFKIVKAASNSVYKNRRYLDQSGWSITSERPGGPTHYGELGPVEWQVKWQAPPGDSGKIYFYAAGNSTNGDDACFSSGDFVFTTVESTTAGSAVGVPGFGPFEGRTDLAAPVPNPMRARADLAFSLARGGVVDLSVFDLSGRLVRNLVHEFRPSGNHSLVWDGRDDYGVRARTGVYFVRLKASEQPAISRKLVLGD